MILETKDLYKQFQRQGRSFHAVDGVNLCADEGELIGITGQSGSGKSTLFHLISGLLRPSSGSIHIEKVNIAGNNQKEQAELRSKKIGYIMQGQNLLFNFNVIDNVCMPCYLAKDKKDVIKRGVKLLEFVGLEERRADFPADLSGGELQRIAIARALITSPALIIADEPTGNLDPDNSLRIMQLLKEVSQKGTAVIVSTHNLELLSYFNKTFNMAAGKLMTIG